jgi:hypothetical protein
MGSRTLDFSRASIPLKIYSADGFYHAASTVTAATERFKIPGMHWETACLTERNCEEGGRDVAGTRRR